MLHCITYVVVKSMVWLIMRVSNCKFSVVSFYTNGFGVGLIIDY